ncbi:RDD family protein [Veronia pacifica]|uniref:RDD domain-containing protein n=1 Tax=Veronia pacifica TaxID=1080227 RepID=A0A1C3EQV1_9GAMM|nr:RDD family protein [Veronia pacifica]ODA35628.1 hypothetical protein A8L45_03140 [Veronia pacifica]
MDVSPDYSKYNIIDLFEALDSLDEAEYPERREEIKRHINARLLDNPAISEECLLKSADEYSFFILWRRLLAFAIDASIAGLFTYFLLDLIINTGGDDWAYRELAFCGFIFSSSLVVYRIFCQALFRFTIGKYVFGIKLADSLAEGDPKLRQVCIRECFLLLTVIYFWILAEFALYNIPFHVLPDFSVLVSFIIYILVMFADLLFSLSSDKRQTVHDILAKTVVMRKE